MKPYPLSVVRGLWISGKPGEGDIAFIRIVNRDNRVLDQTEPAPDSTLSPLEIDPCRHEALYR